MIPGGVGTFDILVLIGLTRLGFNDEVVAATILIYRLSYYIVPFLIGLILLLFEIFTKFRKKIKYSRRDIYDS